MDFDDKKVKKTKKIILNVLQDIEDIEDIDNNKKEINNKKTIIQHPCKWLNQKGEPCPWNSIASDKNYCKRHSIYEDIFIPSDIKSLLKCSGCKNYFKPEKESKNKTCIKCIERKKNIRIKENEEIKQNSLKKCVKCIENDCKSPYNAMDNDDYCKKHQSYKKWKEITDTNKKVCNNWTRGCFDIIDDKYNYCENCRIKNRVNENKNNKLKKNNAIEFNKKIDNNKKLMCMICNKVDNENNFTNQKCLKCYKTYKKAEENRNNQNPKIRILSDYKSRSKNKNIEWKLDDEYAIKLFESKCHYCNHLVGYNGIDRLDSKETYTKSNCVSCCKTCNIMKNTKCVDNFINTIKYLLIVNGIIEYETIDTKNLFICDDTNNYSKFVYDSKNRNINNTISKETYEFITTLPCNYCKNNFINGSRGIDRINSTIGYIYKNITPSCYTCNIMKNILSQEQFFEHLEKIYNFTILKKKMMKKNQ